MPPRVPPIPDLLQEKPAPAPAPKPSDEGGTLQQLGKVSAIGTAFAFTVAGGVLLGWAVQRWVVPSWSPWPILVGSIAGLIAAGIRFVKDAKGLTSESGSDKTKAGS